MLFVAYLGDTQEESDKRTNKLALKSIFYGLGLASTFSVYGLSAGLVYFINKIIIIKL